jgi:hypothetical protein
MHLNLSAPAGRTILQAPSASPAKSDTRFGRREPRMPPRPLVPAFRNQDLQDDWFALNQNLTDDEPMTTRIIPTNQQNPFENFLEELIDRAFTEAAERPEQGNPRQIEQPNGNARNHRRNTLVIIDGPLLMPVMIPGETESDGEGPESPSLVTQEGTHTASITDEDETASQPESEASLLSSTSSTTNLFDLDETDTGWRRWLPGCNIL